MSVSCGICRTMEVSLRPRLLPSTAVTEYGCYRLGARIWDLKAQGVPIKSETVTGKNRYGERTCFARYSLVKEVNAQ